MVPEISEGITWEICPRCGRRAAVGWSTVVDQAREANRPGRQHHPPQPPVASSRLHSAGVQPAPRLMTLGGR
jgi:hypothetical protein